MISFSMTADSRSRDVKRDGKLIGVIMWHSELEPRFEHWGQEPHYLTLNEMKRIAEEVDELRKQRTY